MLLLISSLFFCIPFYSFLLVFTQWILVHQAWVLTQYLMSGWCRYSKNFNIYSFVSSVLLSCYALICLEEAKILIVYAAREIVPLWCLILLCLSTAFAICLSIWEKWFYIVVKFIIRKVTLKFVCFHQNFLNYYCYFFSQYLFCFPFGLYLFSFLFIVYSK